MRIKDSLLLREDRVFCRPRETDHGRPLAPTALFLLQALPMQPVTGHSGLPLAWKRILSARVLASDLSRVNDTTGGGLRWDLGTWQQGERSA